MPARTIPTRSRGIRGTRRWRRRRIAPSASGAGRRVRRVQSEAGRTRLVQAEFDPYYIWLGIPPGEQPPHHYRLLGLGVFESNPNVIEIAADRQMRHVQTFKTGPNSAASQKLLNELSQARICLLRGESKAEYDRQLR